MNESRSGRKAMRKSWSVGRGERGVFTSERDSTTTLGKGVRVRRGRHRIRISGESKKGRGGEGTEPAAPVLVDVKGKAPGREVRGRKEGNELLDIEEEEREKRVTISGHLTTPVNKQDTLPGQGLGTAETPHMDAKALLGGGIRYQVPKPGERWLP